MITTNQRNEIMRLAGLMATKRVRKYAAQMGKANPLETPTKMEKQAQDAADALLGYLNSLLIDER